MFAVVETEGYSPHFFFKELRVIGCQHVLCIECCLIHLCVTFFVVTQWSVKWVDPAHMGAHQGTP